MHFKVRRIELIIILLEIIFSLTLSGCKFLCFPGTFNMATGNYSSTAGELVYVSGAPDVCTCKCFQSQGVVSDVIVPFF